MIETDEICFSLSRAHASGRDELVSFQILIGLYDKQMLLQSITIIETGEIDKVPQLWKHISCRVKDRTKKLLHIDLTPSLICLIIVNFCN
jgi:hypothetical protein